MQPLQCWRPQLWPHLFTGSNLLLKADDGFVVVLVITQTHNDNKKKQTVSTAEEYINQGRNNLPPSWYATDKMLNQQKCSWTDDIIQLYATGTVELRTQEMKIRQKMYKKQCFMSAQSKASHTFLKTECRLISPLSFKSKGRQTTVLRS